MANQLPIAEDLFRYSDMVRRFLGEEMSETCLVPVIPSAYRNGLRARGEEHPGYRLGTGFTGCARGDHERRGVSRRRTVRAGG